MKSIIEIRQVDITDLNVDTIDLGVPVLSMHAPYEIVSKLDTYMAYRAFLAFMND